MKKLTAAIIGAGQIARVTHIPNLHSIADVTIAGICDTNYDAAKAAALEFSIANYYGSHLEMLDALKPDLVIVCVPNKFHCQITVDAMKRGSHVLCEKPPAISLAEAEMMEQTAREHGTLLSYGFHFRHSREVALLKRKIEQNQFGDIYSTRVQWLRRRGIPGWGNFTNKALQGGGPLIDIGAHMLDAALYLLDYPEVSYVCSSTSQKLGKYAGAGLMGSWDKEKFTIEDSLFGFIQFKNGASLSLETAFAINMKEKDLRGIHLFGERMGATVFPLEIFGEDDGEIINTSYPFMTSEDRHLACIRNFTAACMGTEELLIKAWQGTYVQRIICALYQSSDQQRPVMNIQ